MCVELGGEVGDKGNRSRRQGHQERREQNKPRNKQVISGASKVSPTPANYYSNGMDLSALIILSHGRILEPHTKSGIDG